MLAGSAGATPKTSSKLANGRSRHIDRAQARGTQPPVAITIVRLLRVAAGFCNFGCSLALITSGLPSLRPAARSHRPIMSDAKGDSLLLWPPKYAAGTGPAFSFAMRYTNIQGLAFVISCVSMTGYLLRWGPFENSDALRGLTGTMLALYLEILLLAWRWTNELVHGECDLSGYLHHGAFAMGVVLLEVNEKVSVAPKKGKFVSEEINMCTIWEYVEIHRSPFCIHVV